MQRQLLAASLKAQSSQPATNETGGIVLHPFLQHFDATFIQSGAAILEKFLQCNSPTKHWLLLSDYAFHDKTKNSDAATFTFVPVKEDIRKLFERFRSVAPKDIKDVKEVRSEFIALIKDYPTFSVSVLLGRNRRLSKLEREGLTSELEMLRRMVDGWPPQPNGGDYSALSRDFKILLEALKKPSVNMRVIRDMIIVSNLAAYLAFVFHRQLEGASLVWATDRDSMLRFLAGKVSGSLFHHIAHTLHHVLCEQVGIDSGVSRFDLADPEEEGKVWYDDALRVPDLICGALADLTYEAGQPLKWTHPKFRPVGDYLFPDQKSQLIFSISFDSKSGEPLAGRLMFGAPLEKSHRMLTKRAGPVQSVRVGGVSMRRRRKLCRRL